MHACSAPGTLTAGPLSLFLRAQPSFLAAFGLGPDAAPTLLVLSPKKARGARLTGAFDGAGVNAMVEGLLTGKQPTTPFQVSPHSLRAPGLACIRCVCCVFPVFTLSSQVMYTTQPYGRTGRRPELDALAG